MGELSAYINVCVVTKGLYEGQVGIQAILVEYVLASPQPDQT